MKVENIIENPIDLNVSTKNLGKSQNKFLDSTLGKVIDTGLNIGIRMVLPDIVEDGVIEIKDELMKNGFKAGTKQAINSSLDIGKSVTGMVTGNFESINQARNVIKSGGILDGISDSLSTAINETERRGKISHTTGKVLKAGKNAIISSIEQNIEKNFTDQINSLDLLGKYSTNWEKYYKQKDLTGMTKEYNKIINEEKKILPIEETIKKIKYIQNIQTLIKNKNGNFNLSTEELELAKRFT